MDSKKKSKYIPLNTSETAVLHDTNTILPRDEIYKPLAELIRQARDRAKEAILNRKSLDALREHNGISIDGDRGTGKTAVLVNLKRYLEQEYKELLNDVHILNPIDPTLLEDGESLFLHIIVAAVLHDDGIKHAQRNKPVQSRKLNQSLDQLAHSLEAVDTQKERHGMDKVRAMYGNKQLADSVHEFFFAAAQLLEKELLILPIDDVDTSLNLAFENLEIIRRYLTTPYVLPIISGDRGLYHEVTWRDFHGRLIKDSTYNRQEAYITATDLAEEYQRKVLPFPRRLTMPNVSSYWQWDYDRKNGEGNGVMIGDSSNGVPLANFISWLEIYLTGPVNGLENSRLPLPIPSIRALTQLVNHCSDFIPNLPSAIRNADSDLEVRQLWQMSHEYIKENNNATNNTDKKHINSFINVLGKNNLDHEEFKRKLKSSHSNFDSNNNQDSTNEFINLDLTNKLADYFRFEPKAGAIYLILLAKQHWKRITTSGTPRSVFDTPLFQPLKHNTASFNLFDKHHDLSAWADMLVNRLPEEWLTGLKYQKTILPYPVAEIGVNSSKRWDYAKKISSLEFDKLTDDIKNKSIFLINMLVQHNFYTNAKQSMLLNIGRIFELIIASITGPISLEDIYEILNRAPFFSTAALAPTKTLKLEDRNEDEDEDEDEDDITETMVQTDERKDDPQFYIIKKLQSDIAEWRNTHGIDTVNISPWLVYKVFNKVYSQVASGEFIPKGMTHIGTTINKAAHVFYATWFAFGSFEKGELFGLRNVVATSNTNPEKLKNVENNESFNINVRPFLTIGSQNTNKPVITYKDRSPFGKNTRAISYYLADHPLKNLIDDVIQLDWPKSEKEINAQAIKFLRKKLGMTTKNTNKSTIKTAAHKISLDDRENILYEMKTKFTASNSTVKIFASVCKELN